MNAEIARLLADLRAEVRSIRGELIGPARAYMAAAWHWHDVASVPRTRHVVAPHL